MLEISIHSRTNGKFGVTYHKVGRPDPIRNKTYTRNRVDRLLGKINNINLLGNTRLVVSIFNSGGKHWYRINAR